MRTYYVVHAHGASVVNAQGLQSSHYNHQISRRQAEQLVGNSAIQQARKQVLSTESDEIYVSCGCRPHPVDLQMLI